MPSQQTRGAPVTLLLRQKDVVASLWRNGDVIITWYVCWVIEVLPVFLMTLTYLWNKSSVSMCTCTIWWFDIRITDFFSDQFWNVYLFNKTNWRNIHRVFILFLQPFCFTYRQLHIIPLLSFYHFWQRNAFFMEFRDHFTITNTD